MFFYRNIFILLILLCCLQRIESIENVGNLPENNPYSRVLEVDGGGIRGAYAAAVLQLMLKHDVS